MAKKILIVDDAPIVRLMLRDVLEEEGYSVVGECESGEDALDKYKELQPDLITMDITMPKKDGIEALKEILSFDKKAKVMMISAIDQRDLLMQAIKLGAFDYIVKPFEKDRVISAIKRAFGEG